MLQLPLQSCRSPARDSAARRLFAGCGLRLLAAAVFGGCVPALRADGQPAPPDNSQYHLFRPAPREAMRELSTDRPDQTESPYTVDAGHFQLEMDLLNYTHDRKGDMTAESLAVAPVNFKMGLLNQVDLQFVIDSYLRERITDRAAGSVTKAEGIGDVQTRLKVNLWGNDGGATALALMPFVKWPTAKQGLGNDAIEGGVIVPLGVGLGERFSLGLMTEVDFLRQETDDGYHAGFVNSITLGVDLTPKIGVYVEFFTVVTTERDTEWQGQFDVGVTYGLAENLQLDAGVNMGVTPSAPDWQPFVGISWRY